MALEVAPFINGLNPANPAGNDLISAGDDHIRLLKSSIKATFPNLAGAMTATQVELNCCAGVTAPIQTQLDSKTALGHIHAETDIADGNTFPRIAANEGIAGLWDFWQVPTFLSAPLLHTGSIIPETQIADENVLARVAANEAITGSWNFQSPPLAAGLGMLRWGTAGMTSARVYLVPGIPPDTGTPGDIYFVY